MAPAARPGASSSASNPLKSKMGGLPMWAWGLGLAVVVGGIWYVRRRNAAAAAAASAATSGSGVAGTGAASTPYGPPSYGYMGTGIDPSTLAAILSSQGSGATAGSGTAQTLAGTPTPTLLGSGYYLPGSTTPITDTKGNTYEWVQTTAQLHGLQQQGAQFFYQPLPGYFAPYTVGGNVIAPVFVRLGPGSVPSAYAGSGLTTTPAPIGTSVPGLQPAGATSAAA